MASLTMDGGGSNIINSTGIKTTGNQTYSNALILGNNTTLTATGNSNIAINNGVSGAFNLNLVGGTGSNNFTLNGALTANSISVTGGSANNSFLTVRSSADSNI